MRTGLDQKVEYKRKDTKEAKAFADAAGSLIGRLSLHGHDVAHLTFKFEVDPTSESSVSFMNVAPWQLSTWSPPPLSKMDCMD